MTHDSVYATGQRVGDYRLLRQLSAGGFADVYLAEPLYEDGQPVAIKLLTHLLGHTDGLHAFMTFIQEARMIHLKHPHIVPVQDFGISREGSDIPKAHLCLCPPCSATSGRWPLPCSNCMITACSTAM